MVIERVWPRGEQLKSFEQIFEAQQGSDALVERVFILDERSRSTGRRGAGAAMRSDGRFDVHRPILNQRASEYKRICPEFRA
jgi:hypothetical protein